MEIINHKLAGTSGTFHELSSKLHLHIQGLTIHEMTFSESSMPMEDNQSTASTNRWVLHTLKTGKIHMQMWNYCFSQFSHCSNVSLKEGDVTPWCTVFVLTSLKHDYNYCQIISLMLNKHNKEASQSWSDVCKNKCNVLLWPVIENMKWVGGGATLTFSWYSPSISLIKNLTTSW